MIFSFHCFLFSFLSIVAAISAKSQCFEISGGETSDREEEKEESSSSSSSSSESSESESSSSESVESEDEDEPEELKVT